MQAFTKTAMERSQLVSEPTLFPRAPNRSLSTLDLLLSTGPQLYTVDVLSSLVVGINIFHYYYKIYNFMNTFIMVNNIYVHSHETVVEFVILIHHAIITGFVISVSSFIILFVLF